MRPHAGLALMALLLACAAPMAGAQGSFRVICYHEVRDDVRDYPDAFATDASALVAQFAWLQANGYVPVSLEAIVQSRAGGKPLPDKAVLLSFDDAYESFYTRVYPLLREFRFPALLGVVGKWIDEPNTARITYGEKANVRNATFPSWAQLREMAGSGLVEIASHTYDLHRGVPANPQGNEQPAATTRIHDPASGRYEDDGAWRERVSADLARNSSRIETETGRRPRAIVWPYGSYNGELVRIAAELGMTVALTLEAGTNTPQVPLTAIRRVLLQHNPALVDFSLETRGPIHREPVRVVQLALDALHDSEPLRQEAKLSVLLERIDTLRPTHVFLEAASDADGDGLADAAWFPNRHLPMRADLLNRVAWQLATRTDVKVFAVLPVAGLRLAPAQVAEVYGDLARHVPIDGLVFLRERTGAAGGGDFERDTDALAAAARPWRALKIAREATRQPPGHAGADFILMPDAVDPSAGRSDARVVYLLRGDGEEPIAQRMGMLQLGGALNFGYRGDDYLRDRPALPRIAPAMSLRYQPR